MRDERFERPACARGIPARQARHWSPRANVQSGFPSLSKVEDRGPLPRADYRVVTMRYCDSEYSGTSRHGQDPSCVSYRYRETVADSKHLGPFLRGYFTHDTALPHDPRPILALLLFLASFRNLRERNHCADPCSIFPRGLR
jgi:hypothetical protein